MDTFSSHSIIDPFPVTCGDSGAIWGTHLHNKGKTEKKQWPKNVEIVRRHKTSHTTHTARVNVGIQSARSQH